MEDRKTSPRGDVWASIDWVIGVLLGAAIGAGVVLGLARDAITADEVTAVTGVFAATATFGAVWVALLPIRLSEQRRMAAAHGVGLTAQNLLYVLAAHLEIRRLWNWQPRPIFAAPIVMNAIERLWDVLPRTESLDAKEQAAIARALNQWEWQANLEVAGPLPIANECLHQVLASVVTGQDLLAGPLANTRFYDLPAVRAMAAQVTQAPSASSSP